MYAEENEPFQKGEEVCNGISEVCKLCRMDELNLVLRMEEVREVSI